MPKATPAAIQAAPMDMPAIWPLERGFVAPAGPFPVGVDVDVDVVVVSIDGVLVGGGAVDRVSIEEDVDAALVVLFVVVEVDDLLDVVAGGGGKAVDEDVIGANVKTPLCGPNLNVAVMTPSFGCATCGWPVHISHALEKEASTFPSSISKR